MGPVTAGRKVRHERLLRRLDEHRQVAAKLSGARGSKAKKTLLATEEDVKVSEDGLGVSIDDIEPAVLAKETQLAAEMLADVQTSLEVVS
jgi:ATP-binding cassette subfamily F protein 3